MDVIYISRERGRVKEKERKKEREREILKIKKYCFSKTKLKESV